MKNKYCLLGRCILLIVASMAAVAPPAIGQGTAFSYQGRLTDNAQPATGRFDFQFHLRDALAGGNSVGTTNTLTSVAVNNGVFSAMLDFGTGAFNGSERWVEIGVRTNGSAAAYTTLVPRQQITSTPYAMRSLSASNADTAVNAAQLGGTAANQFVQSSDARLTDTRPPSGGSSNYIQNTHNEVVTQDDSSFSITGNGSVGGYLSAYKGVLGIGAGYGVSGNGNGAGVYGYSGEGYGISGNSFTGTGVYGTTEAFFGGGYGVYGFVNTGTTNAGVYGKSIAMNGSGVLGQADSGANASGVWGKAAQGRGVVGQSSSGTGVYGFSTINGIVGEASGSNGNGVVGEANGSSAANGVWGKSATGTGVRGEGDDSGGYGVYGKSLKGTAVRGITDTGRAVDGFASGNGGVGVYGNNLGSNTKGYAGDFFGRVRVSGDLIVERNGALRVTGAGVGTSTAAFIHVITAANLIAGRSVIDHPDANGDPNAILIITARAGVFTDIPRYMVAYGSPTSGRWAIALKDPDTVIGGSFNVLVIKP
jgi:hypothetical protein